MTALRIVRFRVPIVVPLSLAALAVLVAPGFPLVTAQGAGLAGTMRFG